MGGLAVQLAGFLGPLLIGVGGAALSSFAIDEFLLPIFTGIKSGISDIQKQPLWAYVISETHIVSLFSAYASAWITGFLVKTSGKAIEGMSLVKK